MCPSLYATEREQKEKNTICVPDKASTAFAIRLLTSSLPSSPRVHFNVMPKATLTFPSMTILKLLKENFLSLAGIAADTQAVRILQPRKLKWSEVARSALVPTLASGFRRLRSKQYDIAPSNVLWFQCGDKFVTQNVHGTYLHFCVSWIISHQQYY